MKRIISIFLLLLILLTGCQAGEGSGTKPTVCAHTDVDENGLCDKCEISVVVVVDLYTLNDLHGKFADTVLQPGVDELTTYLKTMKAVDDHVVLLSSGDMWQGSPESNNTKGQIVTDWMNELDFAAMTVGNHEYDWGEAPVKKNAETAEFPLLGINIYDRKTNQRVDYVEPSVMVKCGDATIGIIGAIGDCYSSIAPEQVENIYFKTGSELTRLVKEEADRLREAGADFIVYSIHDGYGSSSSGTQDIYAGKIASYYDIALSNGYVDLVFEGHSHQKYVLHDRHGVYHLQNGGENEGLSHVEVAINYVNDTSSVNTAEFVATSAYTTLADDPIVAALMDKYDDQIADAMKVLGTNSVYRTSNQLRQMVANLYYKAGQERWGKQYDIALGGGFITVRSPYDLMRGDVTYGTLQMLFPFDNQLVLCSIQGRDLSSRFFRTNNSNYCIAYGDYGREIKNNIDPDATYYVVVDTYSASYAPNRLTVVERYDEGVYARDLLADYVKTGGLE